MIEPLFWNPLPAAAEWLSVISGQPFDALKLVDTVARMTPPEHSSILSVIKVVLDRDLICARTTSSEIFEAMPIDAEQRLYAKFLDTEFGPPPIGVEYIGAISPNFAPVSVSSLLEILVHGSARTSLLRGIENCGPNEAVWVMPWGAAIAIKPESCGIARDDLIALGESLERVKPAGKQTPEQRQALRYQACLHAGVVFSPNPLHGMPRGIGRVAATLGITRQSLTADLVAHIERLQKQSS